jgi:hypothetical protein
MKDSILFNQQIRNFLADFGPTLVIVFLTFFTSLPFFSQFGVVEKLQVPSSLFSTSTSITSLLNNMKNSSFLINLFRNHCIFTVDNTIKIATIIPALLLSMLFYLDQNISVRAVNVLSKTKKGTAYHIDLLVLSIIIFFQSFFCLPWTCAATVQSLNHIRSLSEVKRNNKNNNKNNIIFINEDNNNNNNVDNNDIINAIIASDSNNNNSGDNEEMINHVIETRITGFLIHASILLSLLILPILSQIPIAVISGIFIYLGRKLMKTNLFFNRINNVFQEKKYLNEKNIFNIISRKSVYKFLTIQTLMIGLIWKLKQSKNFSLFFPSCIALLMIVRVKILPRLFNEKELDLLDPDL